MYHSTAIARIINEIAAKHGVDLTVVGASIKLEQESYMPLVIECVGKNQVSVAHYFEQNRDLVADPEIVFFTGYGNMWVPLFLQQPPVVIVGLCVFNGYREVAQMSSNGKTVARMNSKGVEDVCEFANLWAKNIREQGWLNAKRADSDINWEDDLIAICDID